MPPHERLHVHFFQQMAALRRLEQEVGDGVRERRPAVCGFSQFSACFYVTFAFYLPLTTAWGLKRGKHCFYMSQDTGLKLVLWSLLAQG